MLGTMRGAPKPTNEEDDEVEVEDRGQALIRKRQKERKQLRKAKEKERERRLGDGITSETSAPPTGQLDESFTSQQARGMTSRSVSRTRVPSVTRDGRGSDYFASSIGGEETPAGLSPRDERRPASVYSSVADEDEEEAQDQASVIDDVIQDVLDEQTAEEETASEDEDEGDASAEGDEGVTLKDRQDVSAAFGPTDNRQSTLSTPLVCPSGNLLCTASLDQSLEMRNRLSTPYHPQRQNDTCYLATFSGCCFSVGG